MVLRILNSDGRRHPVENALAVFVLLDGIASFVLSIVLRNSATGGHLLAIVTAITGVAALLIGLYAQMVSATREQRVLIVTGIIAGFVGVALGLAHGGLGG
jgi:hypothetical protein